MVQKPFVLDIWRINKAESKLVNLVAWDKSVSNQATRPSAENMCHPCLCFLEKQEVWLLETLKSAPQGAVLGEGEAAYLCERMIFFMLSAMRKL